MTHGAHNVKTIGLIYKTAWKNVILKWESEDRARYLCVVTLTVLIWKVHWFHVPDHLQDLLRKCTPGIKGYHKLMMISAGTSWNSRRQISVNAHRWIKMKPMKRTLYKETEWNVDLMQWTDILYEMYSKTSNKNRDNLRTSTFCWWTECHSFSLSKSCW